MEATMNYPVFVSEQVLTANNLNDIVKYLNEQDLSTRRNLIGIGIVCGLDINSDLSTYIKISCGCGVTSLGFLVDIPEQDLHYYRKYADAASPPYSKFIGPDRKQFPLWELLTEKEFLEADDRINDKPLKNQIDGFGLVDMAVLLYIELKDKELGNCIDEGCDEKGISRLFNIRKLLIRKSDLLKILRRHEEIGIARLIDETLLSKRVKPSCYLEPVKQQRLNRNLSDLTSLNLSDIQTWSRLKSAYLKIIEEDVIQIGSALYQSYELFQSELKDLYSGINPFSGYNHTSTSTNELYLLIENELNKDEFNTQYAYDFLSDLVKAYDEFCETAATYQAKCCVDTDIFPYHLMLGLLPNRMGKTDHIFRQHWQSSMSDSRMKDVLAQLRLLHFKIFRMKEEFNFRTFTELTDIIITPGKFSGWPLSEHSMAHFYNNGSPSTIQNDWNYELTKTCKVETVLSYFPSKYSSVPFVLNPLNYSLHNYEYFRIEGHIGQEYKSVLAKLRQLVAAHNLPFDLLCVKLSSDHLDVEVEDHCFNDIQTVYKCNRDEYLACLRFLTKLVDQFLDLINKAVEINPKILDVEISKSESQVTFIRTIRQLRTILTIYAYFLHRIENLLPEHIRNFDYKKFQVTYFIVWAFTLAGQIFLGYASNLVEQLFMPYASVTLLKTMFDRLIDDCMDAKFKSIHEMYRERLVKLQMGRLFPGYVDGSPGMEHIAGVKEGGTFILVYDEMPEEEPEIPKVPEKPPEEKIPCLEDEESKKVYLNVLQYAHVISEEPVLFHELDGKVNLATNMERMRYSRAAYTEGATFSNSGGPQGEKAETATEGKTQTQDQAQPMAQTQTTNYTNMRVAEVQKEHPSVDEFLDFLFGKDEPEVIPRKKYRVVADFAIPFRCCTSCLQVDEIPTSEISIKLFPAEFCKTDSTMYPIILDPAGGKLDSSANGIKEVKNDNGITYYFIPNTANWTEEDVALTYTVEEKTVQTTVKLYNPIAKFKVSDETDEKGNRSIVLTNNSQNADTFKWSIRELRYRSTEKDPKPIILTERVDMVTVTLFASKGKCQDTETLDYPIPKPVEVTFDLDRRKGYEKYEYCNDDDHPYKFTAQPPGGEVTGTGPVLKDDTGNFHFVSKSLKEGNYGFEYMGEKIEVYVNDVPEIDFKTELLFIDRQGLQARMKFIYEGEILTQLNWNFGDSTSPVYTSKNEEEHLFNLSAKTFEVGLIKYVESGCHSIKWKKIDFRPYLIGWIPPENFGLVSLRSHSDSVLHSRLTEYDFTASDKLLVYHDTLLEEAGSSEEKRKLISSGQKNRIIAKNYQKAFDSARNTIEKAKEKGDEEMAIYLTKMYIAEVQQLVSTLAVLDRDPLKRSALYKALASTEKHLKELKKLSVNIDPDSHLQNMIAKSLPLLGNKNNTTEVLNNLKSII